MHIVIKISENHYNQIKSTDDPYLSGAERLIKHGTLLPAGHGDLIDVNTIIGKIHGVKSITAVLDAPIIIEADTESEDKE